MRYLKLVFSFSLLISAKCFSQVPEGINFQLVVRNFSNTLISNSGLSMRVQIKQGSSIGNIVYSEKHTVSTNQQGLASFVIGQGVVLSGNFSIINWANGPYFASFGVDFTGQNNFQDYGTQQLMSVPYALYSKSTGSINNSIQHYNSGNSSELIATLPITPSSPYQKMVIYSIPIANLNTNDILQASCEFEVTNPYTYNVMIASQIILANNPTDITGIEITEANGFNVDQNMHHGVVIKTGTLTCSANYPMKYVNVIGYSASTQALANHNLIIEQDYGRLSVLVFK
ncbi:MAG: hypothetical protein NT109_02075 [Flavobacteriia bacterium]|nr:hypothetical protein [Flavobacteriia bacterium]